MQAHAPMPSTRTGKEIYRPTGTHKRLHYNNRERTFLYTVCLRTLVKNKPTLAPTTQSYKIKSLTNGRPSCSDRLMELTISVLNGSSLLWSMGHAGHSVWTLTVSRPAIG